MHSIEGSLDDIVLPEGATLVRATGFCSACDHRFNNELVVRFASPSSPTGWAYMEPRHLTERQTS